MHLQVDRRAKVLVVVAAHLLLMFLGLFWTILDIINEQYPFSLYELTALLVHYFGHSMLIYLLVLGLKYSSPLLYLPWLSVFLGVFGTASFLWLESVLKASRVYFWACFGNLLILGLCWFSWSTILNEFLFLLLRCKQKTGILKN